eukprot:Seg1552.4 transcript_id=Seg1552.4/GoldUCD/mRNA.D3Y31 product="Protein pangolin isoforms A/H/I/S" protein_id=Seg1552.4/GoldUCD/D3Y31
MPQLPTNTAEEYGADDEVKEYRQEDDEGSENSTVDVVNDIKSDLIKKDAEDQTLDSGKEDSNYVELQGRNIKGENAQGVYGRPAPVIVGPHSKLPDSSQTPIAQLLAFPQRYYEHTGYPPGCSAVSHPPTHHPVSYATASQIHVPVYSRNERGYYDRPWQHSQVQFGPPPHGYAPYYQPGKTGEARPIPYLDYRHSGHHPMGPQNAGVISYVTQVGPGFHPQVPGDHKGGKDKRSLAHVKKPLNAFMLYMKEMRPKIAAECTLKESAAINQILGKRWHALDRSEQAKYYEMARKERALHMQLYPGWSARDNYAVLGKKKKRRKDKNQELNPKKCRARYGLERQDQWCKPCRRKKKCIRFLAGADGAEAAEEGEHAENIEPSEDKIEDDETKLEDDQDDEDVTDNAPVSETEETVTTDLMQPPPLQTVTTTFNAVTTT